MNLPVLPIYNGIRIIESPTLEIKKLKRMCRSKKKRIIKKWLKNPKNYHMVPDIHYYLLENERALVCHPEIAKRIIAAIEERKVNELLI